MRLAFTVPGPPVPKGRPRTVRHRGAVRTFTPTRTKRYERHVAICAWKAAPAGCGWRTDGRYAATLRVFGARANDDMDNVAKAVLDGCEGVLWKNDRQVELLTVERCAADGDGPRVEAAVEVLP